MSKKYNDYDDYDDYYDDDYDDGYDDYDDYGKPAAVQVKKPAQNQNKNQQNKNQQNNNNKNQANNSNNNKNQNNNNNNKNNNNNNNKNQASNATNSTTNNNNNNNSKDSKDAPSQDPNTITTNLKGKITSAHDLCPTSWIQEKNTFMSQLWIQQQRATHLSAHLLMIGHVDSGKSSLLGRLLLTQGRVNTRTLDGLQKEATQIGKGSFALAWISDEQASERSRGITVDVASQWFLTPHRVVYVWDLPGHKDFVSNMLSAANHAKSAVLLVSARIGEFEAGIGFKSESQKANELNNNKNQEGQTREHALLAFGAGVRNIIVAVNKMDEVNYDVHRYLFICRETKKMLSNIGFDVNPTSKRVRFVPCSAIKGINIASTTIPTQDAKNNKGSNSNATTTISTPNPEALTTWYKNGPSLIDLIDTLPSDNGCTSEKRDEYIPIPTTGLNQNPFSLAVHETFLHPLFGLSIHGKVLTGSCMVKEKIVLFPSGLVAQVKGIECKNDSVQGCFQGDVVTLQLKLMSTNEDVQNTMTTTFASDPFPPKFGKKIIAQIHTNMTLGAIPIIPGQSLLIHTQHLYSIGTITNIIHSYSIAEGEEVITRDVTPTTPETNQGDKDEKKPEDGEAKKQLVVGKKRMITNHSISVVEITLDMPLPFVHLSKFKDAVLTTQKEKEIHKEKLHDDKTLPPLELKQYNDNVDRICIRRDDESVATGIVLDVLEAVTYPYLA